MEAVLGVAAVALLLILTVFRPGWGLAMALCAPLIHPAIGPGGAFVGFTAPGVLFIGAALRLLTFRGEREQNGLCFLDIAVLVLFAYLPLSILFTDSMNFGVGATMRLLYMSVLFYITTRLLCYTTGVNEFCKQLLTGMVLFGVFISIVALVRNESASEYIVRLSIGNNYIGLSIYVTMALIHSLTIVLFMRKTAAPMVKIAAYASLPVLVYTILVCNTRSVVVGLGLVILYYLFRVIVSRNIDPRLGRRVIFGITAFGVASVGYAFANPELWTRMATRFNRMGVDGVDESDVARLELFDTAIKMFVDSPIVGQGIGSFELMTETYPHNIPLEVMADLGLVGLVIMAVMMVGSMLVTLKYQSINAFYIGALSLFQIFEAMISMAFWMQKNLFVFFALAAAYHMLQAGSRKVRSKQATRQRKRRRAKSRARGYRPGSPVGQGA